MCDTLAGFLSGVFMEGVLVQLALDFAGYGGNMTHQLYWHIVGSVACRHVCVSCDQVGTPGVWTLLSQISSPGVSYNKCLTTSEWPTKIDYTAVIAIMQ